MNELPLQRPMTPGIGHPQNWIQNATQKHTNTGQCFCVMCYKKQYPHLHIGDPVPTGGWDLEKLRSLGVAGLYDSEPRYLYHCPVCNEIIEWYEPIEEEYEPVHVKCMSKSEQETLKDIKYGRSSIVREKVNSNDKNREMVSGPRDNERAVQGSPEVGGEPVQGNGKEKGTLVQARGNGTSERPEESGLGIQVEQTSDGASEGPGENGSGEKAPNAEGD